MSPLAALAIFAAGLAAGTVNVIVGSGSLITFPTLLALGYPPVLANVSNNVGLVPGNVSATVAYRRELVGQRRRLIQLGSASLVGGLIGAILLLGLPHSVFKAAVPVLIALAAVLMALQPRMSAALERRGTRRANGGVALTGGRPPHRHLRRLLRGGPGRHPHRPAGHLHRRRPAAAQRHQERPGPHGQRRGRDLLHRHHPRLLVGGRADRRRIDHRRPGRRPLRPAPARPPSCAGSSWSSGSAWPSAWPSSGTDRARG